MTCQSGRTPEAGRAVGGARTADRGPQPLHAPVRVHERPLLLGVRLGGEDDVGELAHRVGQLRLDGDHGLRGAERALPQGAVRVVAQRVDVVQPDRVQVAGRQALGDADGVAAGGGDRVVARAVAGGEARLADAAAVGRARQREQAGAGDARQVQPRGDVQQRAAGVALAARARRRRSRPPRRRPSASPRTRGSPWRWSRPSWPRRRGCRRRRRAPRRARPGSPRRRRARSAASPWRSGPARSGARRR